MPRQTVSLYDVERTGPLPSATRTPHGERRLIFLVHGFNNDELEARANYARFRRALDVVLRDYGAVESIRKRVQALIWEVYWPGFEEADRYPRSRFAQLFTALHYPDQVKKARDMVPRQLASYCRELGPLEVTFVGHSLGCRVVLETIERLMRPAVHGVDVDGFVLMAGAVPVHFLETPGVLHASTVRVRRRASLYSDRDRVLMSSFGLGQARAGEGAPIGLPEACGLTGAPDIWTNAHNTELDHGDYWAGAVGRQAQPDVRALAASMVGVTAERQLAERRLAVNQDAQGRLIAEAELPQRQPAGEDWLRDYFQD